MLSGAWRVLLPVLKQIRFIEIYLLRWEVNSGIVYRVSGKADEDLSPGKYYTG